MKNLAQELKRKRDAEARARQVDPAKNVIYSGDGSTGAGGGGYIVPSGLLNEAAHDALDHTGLTGIPTIAGLLDETAHDALDHTGLTGVFDETDHAAWDHAGLTGVPLISSLRQAYINTDTIVVAHAFGRRPLVQAVGGAGPAYGMGNYGAGDYGGRVDRAVLTPSSIVHDTVNQVTVTLAAADTGEVICIG